MNIKLPRYRQTILAAFCLGILGVFAGCYQVSISYEPDPNDSSSVSSVEVPIVSEKDVVSSSPNQVVNPAKLLTYKIDVGNSQVGVGTLRMSNQTNQAVRLALLSRGSEQKATATEQSKVTNVPAHWDFAPQEGSERGLLLSLPQGSLKLGKGDILVAFAQDGSRRYWGPYVVGETPVPAWNSQRKEWWLILDQEVK
ncbi:hypothetical protein [Calothrix sp. PCC 6303]|uniref:hypothetical protein n=1 Tax=Calothrix sp. PCC 6303 TaxID=1170562 RepID=UPI0002A016BB|nr:hypothetical protein [Calothrix sp. PCC 6303]AFZ00668.1 hypothetical protein Cal6303_1626 [Calothrix sp. PCC 6303]